MQVLGYVKNCFNPAPLKLQVYLIIFLKICLSGREQYSYCVPCWVTTHLHILYTSGSLEQRTCQLLGQREATFTTAAKKRPKIIIPSPTPPNVLGYLKVKSPLSTFDYVPEKNLNYTAQSPNDELQEICLSELDGSEHDPLEYSTFEHDETGRSQYKYQGLSNEEKLELLCSDPSVVNMAQSAYNNYSTLLSSSLQVKQPLVPQIKIENSDKRSLGPDTYSPSNSCVPAVISQDIITASCYGKTYLIKKQKTNAAFIKAIRLSTKNVTVNTIEYKLNGRIITLNVEDDVDGYNAFLSLPILELTISTAKTSTTKRFRALEGVCINEKNGVKKNVPFPVAGYQCYAEDPKAWMKLKESRKRMAELFGDDKFKLNVLSLTKYVCPICLFEGRMSNDGRLSNFTRHISQKHRADVGRTISDRWSHVHKGKNPNSFFPLSEEERTKFTHVEQ